MRLDFKNAPKWGNDDTYCDDIVMKCGFRHVPATHSDLIPATDSDRVPATHSDPVPATYSDRVPATLLVEVAVSDQG